MDPQTTHKSKWVKWFTNLKYFIYKKIDIKEVTDKRLDSMKNIEKMIGEVASIFQRMGNMVQQHDVMIDSIDKNTDQSLDSLEKGRKNINEVYQHTMSNRALILKVFSSFFRFSSFCLSLLPFISFLLYDYIYLIYYIVINTNIKKILKIYLIHYRKLFFKTFLVI